MDLALLDPSTLMDFPFPLDFPSTFMDFPFPPAEATLMAFPFPKYGFPPALLAHSALYFLKAAALLFLNSAALFL
jgi:hypothetical protein